MVSDFSVKDLGGKMDTLAVAKMSRRCCEETRWNKTERLLKCLDKIFITSSNYKLKLGNKSSVGAEGTL